MNEQQRHLERLLSVHRRRLQVLELQAARFGLLTPPHISTEIEDICKEITVLETQLVGGEKMITILFVAADPTNASRLRLGEEYREIQEKLQLA